MPRYDVSFFYRFKIEADDDEQAVEKGLSMIPEEEPTIDVREI